MTQLIIEIPDALARHLAWLASEQNKSVEQVAVEQLTSLLERATESLEERYERFFQVCIRVLYGRKPAKSRAIMPPCMALTHDLSSCRATRKIL